MILNSKESNSSKDALCQLWWKWAIGNGAEDLKFRYYTCSLLFHHYHLLEKGVALKLNKFESLSSNDDFYIIWVEIGSVGLVKKMKM